MRKPYSLQKRKNTKGKTIYYVQFWDKRQKKYLTAKSSGQTSKAAAEKWAMQYIEGGGVNPNMNQTLESFAKDIFEKDGEYHQNNKAFRKSIGIRYLRNQKAYCINHIFPAIGEIKLKDISSECIDKFALSLLNEKGLSASTTNHILSTIKNILHWSKTMDVLNKVPDFQWVHGKRKKRGCLTKDETKKLFALRTWKDNHYVLNLLAFTTGIRQGECRGLKWKCIDFEKNCIHVNASWDNATKALKLPKNNESRTVTIPPYLGTQLKILQGNSIFNGPDDLVFHGEKKYVPIRPESIRRYFYRKLDEIGIDDEKRKERNIVFHSSRYFLNSHLVEQGLPALKIQEIIGHLSPKMTENYFIVDEMADVRAAQDALTLEFQQGA